MAYKYLVTFLFSAAIVSCAGNSPVPQEPNALYHAGLKAIPPKGQFSATATSSARKAAKYFENACRLGHTDACRATVRYLLEFREGSPIDNLTHLSHYDDTYKDPTPSPLPFTLKEYWTLLQQNAFNDAIKEGTRAAYVKVVVEFPSGEIHWKARAQIAKIDLPEAIAEFEKKKSLMPLINFSKQHPRTYEEINILKNQDLSQYSMSELLELSDLYIKTDAPQVKVFLGGLQEVIAQKILEMAQAAPTEERIAWYNEILTAFSDTTAAKQAGDLLVEASFNAAIEKQGETQRLALMQFIKNFPKSPKIKQAKDRIQELRRQTVLATRAPYEMMDYLTSWPEDTVVMTLLSQYLLASDKTEDIELFKEALRRLPNMPNAQKVYTKLRWLFERELKQQQKEIASEIDDLNPSRPPLPQGIRRP